ncbi:MAG: MATE family efflux transporter, partial [Treponema sp.]|nr:MATE family efflux transporter [Treponema sp.]
MAIERSFYSTLVKLALPLALQNLISYGIALADNFMVGSLGDMALSGVFISNQIQLILTMFCSGLGAALVILAAQYIGKGDIKKAKIVITIAIKIAFTVGAVLTIVVLIFGRNILGLFTKEELVIDAGMKYFPIVGFTYVFVCMSSIFLSSMRCVQNTRIGFYSSLTGFIVNVFLG